MHICLTSRCMLLNGVLPRVSVSRMLRALRKDHLCGIGVIPHLASCRKIQDNSVCGHVLLRKYIHFGCMAIALHSMTCWDY